MRLTPGTNAIKQFAELNYSPERDILLIRVNFEHFNKNFMLKMRVE